MSKNIRYIQCRFCDSSMRTEEIDLKGQEEKEIKKFNCPVCSLFTESRLFVEEE